MNSTIIITPVDNIRDNCVVDSKQISKETHDSDMDVFTFEDIYTGKQRRTNLMHVSLYNDVIVKNNIKYKILSMLTK